MAEGYMDVIALNGGGFDTAVAPLGTAISEYQLRLLWRLTDEPIVALDGDKAGINAAMRAIDLALPILSIGLKSIISKSHVRGAFFLAFFLPNLISISLHIFNNS